MFDFFKKKTPPGEPEGLEKAKELGLITPEEVLILEIARAQKKLKDLTGGPGPGPGEKRSHHRSRP
jgi:hypothetical protein